MRRLFTAGAVLLALAGLAPAAAAAPDIKAQLQRIPGLTIVSEDAAPAGFRFFKLTYTQPADHRHPGAGTFQQRFTLLHRDFAAPTVAFTSGYNVSGSPNRSEPTQIVDGNQLSMEYRYFTPSRPEPENWAKQLTIWQAAADEHRAVQAFKAIYPGKWLATGGSKGGMTATYFRRFFPDDVDATIPYVAPNDVIDPIDVYNRFLSRVGDDPACRDALKAIQRDALKRRDELGPIAAADAAQRGLTFSIVGSADKSLEISVIDSYFAFWQYQKQADCATVPPAGAPAADVYAWYEKVESLNTYSDQDLAPYIPYYYQAAVQLGSPEAYDGYLRDLLRYPGADQPKTFVPASIRLPRFDYLAMPDIDFWVKSRGTRLLFVYGANDPWGAEPFELGFGSRDSYRYYVQGGNHGSKIAQLAPPDAAAATATVRRWAGLPPVAPLAARSAPAGFPDFDTDLTPRARL
ncbi:tripeptidyl aminopeptidase [Amycolatopsis mediterranei S699]|uniref:Tripeptidyl aminopeptidase n=2 Tax=Amycolatopsis mediterranei TaxID=33910 RepID=A0A9R0UBD3_AMYMS|nr:S28 family serine protease [Amycolatopsis mediterranei]ADJ47853.1 putative secreted tripeptidyl aminopeptidase [Amycolatopsis mediterranei U32]AEK44744.1 tripeptidyl aminopeptidase [Amycolatopsis mediterranei S699]AFO79564.1 tripeptidyl aminopeptidase [Amycolatopsis mediterranei S699]AGT86692.1 tripeptidyl aminopeptidase [Amycolatopsis mediterranei RB]KDO10342.1 tripeptidyl aminopeptidase [Amycolatopsis mediterranei]